MTTATRTNPLSYLTDQLNELKAKGTHFKLRVLDDEQAAVCTFDGKKVINLASNNYLGLTTHPKLREAALEATRTVRRRLGCGPHHRRDDEDPHGTRREDRALQERRSLCRLPVGLRGERGNGLGRSRQRRFHHLRRAESRFDHRRRTAVESQDPGLPPQRHRARGRTASQHQERTGQRSC